eukprot:g26593.t1
MTNDVSWTSHISMTVKKARQRLFFLRQLRKFGMSKRSLTNLYRCTIKSILSLCITWYGNCSAQDHKKLQKVMCTAHIIEVPGDWRIANTGALFKNGSRDNQGDYRPVNL